MKLPFLALAWLASFAAVGVWGAPWWMAGATLAALAPVGFRIAGRNGALLLGAGALLALAGGARYSAERDQSLPDLARFVPSAGMVTIEGTIDSEADRGLTTTGYTLRVSTIDGSPTEGRVLLTLHQYAEQLPGDRVRATGKLDLAPVFQGFDYRAFLAGKGIVATMYRPAIDVLGHDDSLARQVARAHQRLETALNRALPEPDASLAAGIAFGRDQALPDDFKQAFRDSGLAHLTAVSGSNVSLVALLAFLVFTPMTGRRFAIVPALLLVGGYVLLVGFSASVVRAGIMAAILLAGQWLGRPRSGLSALGLAAILMTARDPGAANDAGFQLSFAATAGLIVLQPWMASAWDRAAGRWTALAFVPHWAITGATVSLAATIATAPFLWATFGRISLVSPFVNIVAEPLFVVAFVLSAVTALAGLAWEPAGWFFGLFAYYPLAAIGWIANTAAALPGAAVDVPGLDGQALLAICAAATVPGWLLYRRYAPAGAVPRPGPRTKRLRLQLVGAGGALAAIVVVRESVLPASGVDELTVQVLDVGQGDAILVTSPNGHRLLIDSGPSGLGLARELGAVLPHWDRTIERVLLTHPQEDHVAGFIEVFRRFDVHLAVDTGWSSPTTSATLYAGERPGELTVARGDGWDEGEVRFEVLWPPRGYTTENLNDTSIVLKVTYGRTSFLFTGDSERPVHDALAAGGDLHVDVLKVPHHGSKTTTASFFAAVHPSLAIISVGAGNQFGHPAPPTLDALDGYAGRTLRTDLDGRVTVRSDGQRISFETSR